MISTNLSRSFKNIYLSSSISAWIYAPWISNISMYLPSYACITNEINRSSSDIVGDAKYSPYFKKLRCLLPFAQVHPLIVPMCFYLIRLRASKASLFPVWVNCFGSCGSTTDLFGIAPLSSWFNSLYIDSIDLSLNFFIPLLDEIWLHITLVSVFHFWLFRFKIFLVLR